MTDKTLSSGSGGVAVASQFHHDLPHFSSSSQPLEAQNLTSTPKMELNSTNGTKSVNLSSSSSSSTSSANTSSSSSSSYKSSHSSSKSHHSSKNGINKEIQNLQHQLRQSQVMSHTSRKRIENLTKMAVRIHRGLIRQMEVQHGTYPTKIPSVPSPPQPSNTDPNTISTPPGAVSSLKFAQMLYSQIPVRMKAKDVLPDFPALSLWQDPEYLKKALSNVDLTVAQTPTGLADAPGLRNTAFLQPHVVSMNASQFLHHLKNPDNSTSDTTNSANNNTPKASNNTSAEEDDDTVLYMQSQNNNFPREFPPLANDAPHSIPWANEALNVDGPAAVNLWLGDYCTTSRLHNDNYENLYIQVSGSKEIYLIPPGDAYALDERFLKPLSYGSDMTLHDSFAEALQSLQDGDGASFSASTCTQSQNIPKSGKCSNDSQAAADTNGSDNSSAKFANSTQKKTAGTDMDSQMPPEIATPNILFPTVDPSNPSTFNDIYSNYAFVYRVVLNPGDMLYMPALWYHQVRVIDGAPNVSLNYWYDPPATNGQWMRWDYVRYCSAVLRGYHDPYYFDEEEEKQEIEAMLKMEHQQQIKQMQMMQQKEKEKYQQMIAKKQNEEEEKAAAAVMKNGS